VVCQIGFPVRYLHCFLWQHKNTNRSILHIPDRYRQRVSRAWEEMQGQWEGMSLVVWFQEMKAKRNCYVFVLNSIGTSKIG
jgi:hypothetical protein